MQGPLNEIKKLSYIIQFFPHLLTKDTEIISHLSCVSFDRHKRTDPKFHLREYGQRQK
jgi:hypothetical protein